MGSLAKRWSVSKAEVMRRAIRRVQQDVEAEDKRPSPLQAMEWLQNGAGLSVAEGAEFKENVEAERQARKLGAKNVSVTTFEWQAPGFYAKHGYEEEGRTEKYVGDFYLARMTKRL